MSPEQAEGRTEEIDGRADQFALAALTYVLLTGVDPFPGASAAEVFARIVHGEALPLCGQVTWRAGEVEHVIRRALSKRPTDRYESVLKFARALQEAASKVLIVDLIVVRRESPGLFGVAPPIDSATRPQELGEGLIGEAWQTTVLAGSQPSPTRRISWEPVRSFRVRPGSNPNGHVTGEPG